MIMRFRETVIFIIFQSTKIFAYSLPPRQMPSAQVCMTGRQVEKLNVVERPLQWRPPALCYDKQ